MTFTSAAASVEVTVGSAVVAGLVLDTTISAVVAGASVVVLAGFSGPAVVVVNWQGHEGAAAVVVGAAVVLAATVVFAAAVVAAAAAVVVAVGAAVVVVGATVVVPAAVVEA